MLELLPNLLGYTIRHLSGGDLAVDGDETTAFDPDEVSQMPFPRTRPIYVDLGGNFQVNRIRFFPRLDGRNERRFLQEFDVATSATTVLGEFTSLFAFFPSLPNRQPVVDKRFDSRNVRYVRITSTSQRQWEIAELEIFGDGSLPTGEYVSEPLRLRSANSVFGEMRLEGVNDLDAPILVQTRTGSDENPELYFVLGADGAAPVEVARAEYFAAPPDSQAAIRHNPAWSGFEAVTDRVVRSSGIHEGRSYLQFRLRMSKPDTKLDRIVFEVVSPPLVLSLVAEIAPILVEPGVAVQVRIIDDRIVERRQGRERIEAEETGYQFAVAGEADVETASESLMITLMKEDNRVPLLSNVEVAGVFSPNGDGINDLLELSYSLLTLTKPAPVVWSIYDLSGRRVRIVQDELKDVGNHSQSWDGLDEGAGLVAPGIYLYEVELRADEGAERVRGTVAIAY